jgi:formiminotetrahydrofolate cyclodeaminase
MPEPVPPSAELAGLAAAIAAPSPAPAAGAAIGAVTALAAALVEKACALTGGGALEPERASAAAVRSLALAFAEVDEAAFGEIAAARRGGGDVPEAWAAAARVPLDLADTCASLAELAAATIAHANPNLRGELETAVALARAAGLAATGLAAIDLDAAGEGFPDDRATLAAVRARLSA